MIERLRADVAIVGGGIVGSSAALFLRRLGLSVVLLERGWCGAAASGVNYGGVRTQGRPVSQLPLALRARQLWARLPEFIGIDGEYVQTGHLKLARSEADLHSLQAYRDRVRDHGLDLQILTGTAFRAAWPWLGSQALAGSFCAEDGHANPRLVSPAFARAAQAAGARVIEQCEVTGMDRGPEGFRLTDGRQVEVHAPVLLNCAGAWSLRVAQAFGDDAPLTAIHPGMAVTEPVPRFLEVNVGVEGGGIYGRQTARGNCVMGGSRGVARSAPLFTGTNGPERRESPWMARAINSFPVPLSPRINTVARVGATARARSRRTRIPAEVPMMPVVRLMSRPCASVLRMRFSRRRARPSKA